MSKVGDHITAKAGSWTFGGITAKKFKKHISRSVPLYKEGQILTSQFSEFFISNNDTFNYLSTKFETYGEFSPMKIIILKK